MSQSKDATKPPSWEPFVTVLGNLASKCKVATETPRAFYLEDGIRTIYPNHGLKIWCDVHPVLTKLQELLDSPSFESVIDEFVASFPEIELAHPEKMRDEIKELIDLYTSKPELTHATTKTINGDDKSAFRYPKNEEHAKAMRIELATFTSEYGQKFNELAIFMQSIPTFTRPPFETRRVIQEVQFKSDLL